MKPKTATTSRFRAVVRCGIAMLVSAAIMGLMSAAPAHAAGHHGLQALQTTLTPAEWHRYLDDYVRPDGRVVDVEKGGVSHSEGQAYGMFLAVAANDPVTFQRIYSFTMAHMRGRSDRLVSWIYNPNYFPRITDTNNATDGDIILAYSLTLAALKWDWPTYLQAANPIIDQIADELLVRKNGHWIVKPAAFGFGREHEDGPVLNLSYYIYGAFLLFHAVTEDDRWLDAWRSGLELTERAVNLSGGFAPDWVTLNSQRWLSPANGFAPKSSYDAVRIPLYMALNGNVPSEAFAPFHQMWNERNAGIPKDYHLQYRRKVTDMNDPGYRAIAALAACAYAGERVPRNLQTLQPTTYFATSLHLMSLVAIRSNFPWCADPIPRETSPVTVHLASTEARSHAQQAAPHAITTTMISTHDPHHRTALTDIGTLRTAGSNNGWLGDRDRVGLADALLRFVGLER